MDHLIDLEYILKTRGEQAILDVLFEHVCELGCFEISGMIKNYWQSKSEELTEEDYKGAQEQSIKKQFGE